MTNYPLRGELFRVCELEHGPASSISYEKTSAFTNWVIFHSYTGWWFQHVSTPLKNMKVSWDHYSQYMEQ